MKRKDDLQLKVTGLLLPLTRISTMVEALKEFDIIIEWNERKSSAEISFLDRGDVKKFIGGDY